MRRFIPLSVALAAFLLLVNSNEGVDAADASFEIIAEIPGVESSYGVAVNPNNNRVYVAGAGIIYVIDGETNTVIANIPVGTGPIGIGVNPENGKVYAAPTSGGNSVSVIDGATNTVIKEIPIANNAFGVAVNPVTNRIYVTTRLGGPGRDYVTVIDGETDTVVAIVIGTKFSWHPSDIAVNPNLNRIYVRDGNLPVVIDGVTNEIIDTISGGTHTEELGIAVNPKTAMIYLLNDYFGGPLRVIDGSDPDHPTLETLTVPPPGSYTLGVEVNPTTNHIFVTSYGGTVTVLDGATNTFFDPPIVVVGKLRGVAINPITNRVYIADTEGDRVIVIEDFPTPLAVSLPYRITEESPQQPTIPGATFFMDQFVVDYQGENIVLSEESDGTGDTWVDDGIEIIVMHLDGTTSIFFHNYAPGCEPPVGTLPPYDISDMFYSGWNLVSVRLFDICGGYVWNSALYLAVPGIPQERILPVSPFMQGVAPFTDNDPYWESHVYDDADRWDLGCGETIARCGCATTSVAMVLKYFGATKAPISAPSALLTDPATVNYYFQQDSRRVPDCNDEPGLQPGWASLGYYCGRVYWKAVDKYSSDAYKLWGTQMITFNGVHSWDPDVFRLDIDFDNPVILGVLGEGHWVVGTGYSGDTYTINDPLYDRDTLNGEAEMRRYIRTASDFSAIGIGSINQFLITAPDGKRTGFDPATSTIIEEIPNSWYFFDSALNDATGENPSPPEGAVVYWLIVSTPISGEYIIQVSTPTNEPYNFALYTYDRDANYSLNIFEAQPTHGALPTYNLIYDPNPEARNLALKTDIDIKPGSDPNSINPRSMGNVPVAVLGSEIFDASQIDPETVRFAGASIDVKENESLHYSLEDVNDDGYMDFIAHFKIQDMEIQCGDTSALLIGNSFDGLAIEGTDEINIVGCE